MDLPINLIQITGWHSVVDFCSNGGFSRQERFIPIILFLPDDTQQALKLR